MATLVTVRYPTRLIEAYPGIFTAAALNDNCVGAYFFFKKAGESNNDAGKRCSWNRAKLGINDRSVRRQSMWPGGHPTFGSNYATFREDQPLITGIPDFGSGGGCVFVVSRCDDDTVGNTSADRGFLVGTFGGNTNFGFAMEYASDAASTARVTDYDAGGSTNPNQVDFGVTTSDFEKIRILYGETGRASGGDATLAMVNLSGDGTSPDPTDTTLTGGRSTGSQSFSIGGRIEDSTTVYTPSVTKDIAIVLIFSALPDSTQRAAILAQIRYIMGLMNITELSSSW